jgi:hypothetical protein
LGVSDVDVSGRVDRHPISTYVMKFLSKRQGNVGSGETGRELRYENEFLDLEPSGCDDLSKSCHVVVIRVANLLDEAMNAKTFESSTSQRFVATATFA